MRAAWLVARHNTRKMSLGRLVCYLICYALSNVCSGYRILPPDRPLFRDITHLMVVSELKVMIANSMGACSRGGKVQVAPAHVIYDTRLSTQLSQ